MLHKPRNLFAGKRHGAECRPRNLHPIVFNENEPATKKDLAEFAADFTTKLTAMEERLVRDMWRAVDVVIT